MTDNTDEDFAAIVGTSDMEDVALIAQARALLEQSSSSEGLGRQPDLDTVAVIVDIYGEPTVLSRFTYACPSHGTEHGFVTKAATGQFQIYDMEHIGPLIDTLQGYLDDALDLGWVPFEGEAGDDDDNS